MALVKTYRRRLLERAQDQYGYVTTTDADELRPSSFASWLSAVASVTRPGASTASKKSP
jgi:hypothetical protein